MYLEKIDSRFSSLTLTDVNVSQILCVYKMCGAYLNTFRFLGFPRYKIITGIGHVHVHERIQILIVDPEETETSNNCAFEGQQQFNQPT
jgi:hypothetical protein